MRRASIRNRIHEDWNLSLPFRRQRGGQDGWCKGRRIQGQTGGQQILRAGCFYISARDRLIVVGMEYISQLVLRN